MNQDFAQKWSTALRSGQYKQGSGLLRKGEHFCALGVLADVVDPQGWKKNGYTYKWEHDREATCISKALARRLEMRTTFGTEGTVGGYHPTINGVAVSQLNDGFRKSFTEIADLIDAHWETI